MTNRTYARKSGDRSRAAASTALRGASEHAGPICGAGRGLLAPLAAIMLLFGIPSSAHAQTEYSFAPVPQFEHRKLFGIWKPIVDELHRRTGADFRLTIPFSIQETEQEFRRGTYDFAYINPAHFVHGHSNQAYVPLVSDVVPLRGIVVVAKNSSIQKVEDLKDKVMAIPSHNAYGASLATQSTLYEKCNIRVRVVSVNSHSSVYLHVVNNLADAGGGIEKTLSIQPQAVRDNLRILFTTDYFPSLPVVAHKRVPEELREKVRAAFIDMPKTPEGAALLAKIPMLGVRAVSVEDYRGAAKFDEFWVEGSD